MLSCAFLDRAVSENHLFLKKLQITFFREMGRSMILVKSFSLHAALLFSEGICKAL